MSDRPIDVVLGKLRKVRPAGENSWAACCPAHEDQNPSLSVTVGREDQVLLKCFAGCETAAIVDSLGLGFPDLFPRTDRDPPPAKRREPISRPREPTGRTFQTRQQLRDSFPSPPTIEYLYRDERGHPCAVVFRWDTPNGKDIRPAHYVAPGWRIGAPDGLRSLYRLDRITGLQRVYVVEGEKAADRLTALGFETTTSSGGSAAVKKTDWSRLTAPEVVILPDADTPGRKYAGTVAEKLKEADPNRTVVVLELDGLPADSGDDIVEWIRDVHAGDEDAAARALELAASQALAAERRHRPLLTAAEILSDPQWKEPPSVIRTGVPWFDDIQPFDGLERGSLTVMAAPPRCYKTSILLFLAWNLAETGSHVHYLAGEMTRPALLRRVVAMMAEVSPSLVGDHSDPKSTQKVQDAESRIRALGDRLVLGRAPITLSGIEHSAGVADVVILDYLQLIQPDAESAGGGRVEELDTAMRAVLAITQRGGTVIAAASLNRQNRDSMSLTAIRGSASIEYGATTIYATTEELAGVEDEDPGYERDVEYRCLKQREGTPKPLRFRVDLAIGPLPVEPGL